MLVQHGATDRSVEVQILDSTTGLPKTDVVFNSAGLDLWYRRDGAAPVAITEATLAALTDAHADGGFLHIDDGVYRLDLPDAAFAAGVRGVTWGGAVTGGIVTGGRAQLVPWNPDDAVRLGITALPNAAADAAGGLPISDAGGLDLDARLDAAVSSRASQTSVDDVPTNAELATALAAADDAVLAAVAALNDVSLAAIQSAIADGDDAVLALLGAPAGASVSADLAALLVATLRGEAWSGTLDAIAAGSVTLPSGNGIDPEARLLLVLTGGTNAKGRARFLTHSGVGDVWTPERNWNDDSETVPSGVLTAVAYAVESDTVATTLAAMTEDDAGTPRFTVNALEQAPSGTGASAQSIREEIDANSTQLAALVTAVADVPTNAELTTALGASDDATLAAIAALNNLSLAQLQAELASADDAMLAAIAALNNLSQAELAAAIAGGDDAVLAAVALLATAAELALVKAKTDTIPAAPAAVSDIPTAVQNADALLARHQMGGSNGAAGERVADALAGGLMLISIASGTMTVQHADGTTAFTRTLTRAQLNAIITSAAGA